MTNSARFSRATSFTLDQRKLPLRTITKTSPTELITSVERKARRTIDTASLTTARRPRLCESDFISVQNEHHAILLAQRQRSATAMAGATRGSARGVTDMAVGCGALLAQRRDCPRRRQKSVARSLENSGLIFSLGRQGSFISWLRYRELQSTRLRIAHSSFQDCRQRAGYFLAAAILRSHVTECVPLLTDVHIAKTFG